LYRKTLGAHAEGSASGFAFTIPEPFIFTVGGSLEVFRAYFTPKPEWVRWCPILSKVSFTKRSDRTVGSLVGVPVLMFVRAVGVDAALVVEGPLSNQDTDLIQVAVAAANKDKVEVRGWTERVVAVADVHHRVVPGDEGVPAHDPRDLLWEWGVGRIVGHESSSTST
jgi:hypothetical protein